MENKAELKKRGFLQQQEGYTLHFCVPAGQLMSEQIKAMVEIADKYGTGQINLTARQSVKIPFIAYENIQKAEEEIQKANLKILAYGRSISNITACPGSPICKNSCIDTRKLAKLLDEAFEGEELSCLVKIGVVGCKNNCLKGIKNDICIIGKPVYEEALDRKNKEIKSAKIKDKEIKNVQAKEKDIKRIDTKEKDITGVNIKEDSNNIFPLDENIREEIEYCIEFSHLDMEKRRLTAANEQQLIEKIQNYYRNIEVKL